MAEVEPYQGLKSFAALLGNCLQHAKISQREFAKVAQFGHGSVANWIKNGDPKYKLNPPNYENILKLAPLLSNPKTQKPFTPSELFALLSGEVRYTSEEIKESRFIPPKTQSKPILDDYWEKIVQDELGQTIRDLGEHSDKGHILQSRDYAFHRATDGHVSILPKDGSPAISKEKLSKVHVQIINEVVKIGKQHRKKSSQSSTTPQTPQKRRIKI